MTASACVHGPMHTHALKACAAAHAAGGSAGALWALLICDAHREQPPPHALTAHLPLARLLDALERGRR